MNRKKVIKAIDICLGHRVYNDCPYCLSGKGYTTTNYHDYMLRDAIAMLKEQEEEIENLKQTCQSMMEGICLVKEQKAVKPVLDKQTGRIWLCGKCGSYVGFEDNDPHDPNEFDKYCRDCGTPVLWEGR